jgi:hypothetical protein
MSRRPGVALTPGRVGGQTPRRPPLGPTRGTPAVLARRSGNSRQQGVSPSAASTRAASPARVGVAAIGVAGSGPELPGKQTQATSPGRGAVAEVIGVAGSGPELPGKLTQRQLQPLVRSPSRAAVAEVISVVGSGPELPGKLTQRQLQQQRRIFPVHNGTDTAGNNHGNSLDQQQQQQHESLLTLVSPTVLASALGPVADGPTRVVGSGPELPRAPPTISVAQPTRPARATLRRSDEGLPQQQPVNTSSTSPSPRAHGEKALLLCVSFQR